MRACCGRRPWRRGAGSAVLLALLLAVIGIGGRGRAGAARPRDFGAPQVIGHIGYSLPFGAQLAVAPDGQAAVVWASSPKTSGTAIQLANAKSGGRFSAAHTVAHVPFGPVGLALAVSNAGEVTVALEPSSGGLEVVTQSMTGAMRRQQWIVEPHAVLLGASVALADDGGALLAWDAESKSANAGGRVVAGATWRRRRAARFGRSLSVASVVGSAHVPQPLFIAPDRAAIA